MKRNSRIHCTPFTHTLFPFISCKTTGMRTFRSSVRSVRCSSVYCHVRWRSLTAFPTMAEQAAVLRQGRWPRSNVTTCMKRHERPIPTTVYHGLLRSRPYHRLGLQLVDCVLPALHPHAVSFYRFSMVQTYASYSRQPIRRPPTTHYNPRATTNLHRDGYIRFRDTEQSNGVFGSRGGPGSGRRMNLYVVLPVVSVLLYYYLSHLEKLPLLGMCL